MERKSADSHGTMTVYMHTDVSLTETALTGGVADGHGTMYTCIQMPHLQRLHVTGGVADGPRQ